MPLFSNSPKSELDCLKLSGSAANDSSGMSSTSDSFETTCSEDSESSPDYEHDEVQSLLGSEIESNWSVIFTDDNSTDYDVRSNPSSNEYEAGESDIDTHPHHGPEVECDDVISETDSENIESLRNSLNRKRMISVSKSDVISDAQVEDSMSTIKAGSNEGSVIQFPDPLKAESNPTKMATTVRTLKPTSITEQIKRAYNSIRAYIPLILVGFLIADRTVQLFTPVVFPKSSVENYADSTAPKEALLNEISIFTITKYATKTTTLYKAHTMKVFETVVPEMSILAGEDEPKDNDKLGGIPSWELVERLYHNMIDYSLDFSETSLITANNIFDGLKNESLTVLQGLSQTGGQYFDSFERVTKLSDIWNATKNHFSHNHRNSAVTGNFIHEVNNIVSNISPIFENSVGKLKQLTDPLTQAVKGIDSPSSLLLRSYVEGLKSTGSTVNMYLNGQIRCVIPSVRELCQELISFPFSQYADALGPKMTENFNIATSTSVSCWDWLSKFSCYKQVVKLNVIGELKGLDKQLRNRIGVLSQKLSKLGQKCKPGNAYIWAKSLSKYVDQSRMCKSVKLLSHKFGMNHAEFYKRFMSNIPLSYREISSQRTEGTNFKCFDRGCRPSSKCNKKICGKKSCRSLFSNKNG